MTYLLVILGTLLYTSTAADSAVQDTVTAQHYRIYRADGTPATTDDVVEALRETDVLFIGETHNDPIVHHLQLVLMHRAHHLWRHEDGKPLALSMEQFSRDDQDVVDEYLDDLITEKQFLDASQPWDNYDTDYRPLVEFAKEHDLSVVAANAPRRYVNRVTRLGRESLFDLSETARSYLAPLPYGKASELYREQWDRAMEEAMEEMREAAMKADSASVDHPSEPVSEFAGMAAGKEHAGMAAGKEHAEETETNEDAPPPASGMHGEETMLDTQSLWDATMAYSIAEYQTGHPGTLVIHIVGGFHVAKGTGIPEHLIEYRPGTRMLIVSVEPVEDITVFDAESHANLGDFVILTDESLPRTFDALEQ